MSKDDCSMFKLYPYQREHFDRLVDILKTHKVAIDSSITGAGKTVVAMELGRYFLKFMHVKKIYVFAPPTLEFHWNSYISNLSNSDNWKFYSSHSLHKVKLVEESLIIVDECHLFKNNVKRTDILKKIMRESKKVLMLSATPFDDMRQLNNIMELFYLDKPEKIETQLSTMSFKYKTNTCFFYYHVTQTEQEIKMYKDGYNSITYCYQDIPGQEKIFRPQIFNKGLHKIHDSLLDGLVRLIRKCIDDTKDKLVVVLYFKNTFERLEKEFDNILILNGETPFNKRKEIIAKFQEQNLEHRICAISAEVGSVGIELDDKFGKYPRHMIILPMANSINFCQAVGRIQRTKTLSDSKVTVVQPIRDVTYFKKQIERKFRVLEKFIVIPNFQHIVEDHICNPLDKCNCGLLIKSNE